MTSRSLDNKPHVRLASAAEVEVIRLALTEQHANLVLCVERLEARKAPKAYSMIKARDAVAALLAKVPENQAIEWMVVGRDDVNRVSMAANRFITILRRKEDRTSTDLAMIKVLVPLLDRVNVGWKRPAEIPAEILEQIKAREDGRFWSPVDQLTEGLDGADS